MIFEMHPPQICLKRWGREETGRLPTAFGGIAGAGWWGNCGGWYMPTAQSGKSGGNIVVKGKTHRNTLQRGG